MCNCQENAELIVRMSKVLDSLIGLVKIQKQEIDDVRSKFTRLEEKVLKLEKLHPGGRGYR